MAIRTAADAVRIRRWQNRLLVDADHPSPERMRDCVDAAVRRALGDSVASVLAPLIRDAQDIVFVRRLDVDWAMDASWGPGEIARTCAQAFARELLVEISNPESGNVVRFTGPSEYLASYVAARACAGWTPAWYHDSYEGWAALPASAAIRSALCDDASVGAAALRALSRSSLAGLMATLHERDATAIVAGLTQTPASTSPTDALRSILTACKDDPPPPRAVEDATLGVWLLARTPATPDAATLRAACVIVRALHEAIRAAPDNLIALLTAACEIDGPLRALEAAARAGASDAVRRIVATLAPERTATARGVLVTRFGGGFLLLEDLARLGWDEVCADWPALGETSAASILQLATLARALAGRQWTRVLDDACWRDVLGIPPSITANAIAAWLIERNARRWVARAARRTLRSFALRLPGFAASSPRYLRGNFLAVAATIEFQPERIVVMLSRPPLDLIVRIAGVARGERRWPWLDDRPFVLVTTD